EVVNDVLLTVWQSAERFDPEKGRLSTWLFGIAHNKALKHLQRSRKHTVSTVPVNEETDADESHESRAPGSPDGAVSHQQLAGALRQALTQLSADHRAVVELTYFEDYSYQEIADVLACPVNTVKTRMFHARRRLAEIIGDAGSEHLEQVGEE
nr:sigma-70 family RNA polymerase sigma factor [Gammaproteobacteria bacterium]